MISNYRSDTDNNNLTEEGKKQALVRNSTKLLITVYRLKYKTMPSHCLKCRKNTKYINPVVSNASNGKIMLLSKCTVCRTIKSRFIKKQEAKGILSSLVLKTSLKKVPLFDDTLF